MSEFKTYAELGASVLIKFGLRTNVVQAVPTPNVVQDRTYTSAITLKASPSEPTRVLVLGGKPFGEQIVM